jgi:Fur family ferric uptake transcriptional regulator
MMENKSKSYHTKQKELILQVLKKEESHHQTADEISQELVKENNPVSKATLYRNLDQLVEQGIIKKFSVEGCKSCYQYVSEKIKENHYHLKCETCGKLFHAEGLPMSKIENLIQNEFHFSIDESRTVFYGICDACKKKDLISHDH